MRDTEARSQNLPGSDVYRRDQICYVDDTNAKGTAGRLLRAGYVIFSNTPIVRHYKYNTPFDFHVWYFANEYIIDLLRIQVCYEHYLKARLLLGGFVVHKFRRTSLERNLRDPTTNLVTIENLRQNTEFIFKPEKQYNEIEELSDKTWGFSELIELHTIHSIPETVLNVLERNRRHRNMLHYTEAQPENFDPNDIRGVITNVEETVPPLIDRLADELNLPNLRLQTRPPLESET